MVIAISQLPGYYEYIKPKCTHSSQSYRPRPSPAPFPPKTFSYHDCDTVMEKQDYPVSITNNKMSGIAK